MASLDDGLSVDEGAANSFSIEGFIFIQQQTNYGDFQIAQLKTGTGDDHLTATALPLYALNIVDAGGHDTYDFTLTRRTSRRALPGSTSSTTAATPT